MSNSEQYKTILVAIDLSEESKLVMKKAKQIAHRNSESKILVMHTLEPLGFAYGGDIPMDLTSIQEQLDSHAKKGLNKLLTEFEIPVENQFVVVGMPDTEIHRMAREHKADLIVVGSHARQGLQLLLGSVSTGVLHGAICDVLAVRVGKKKKK